MTGECKFCHQMIEVGEAAYPNEAATAACDCEKAKAERKRLERKRKVTEWIEHEFDRSEAMQSFMKDAVDVVEGMNCSSVVVKLEDITYKVSLNKDLYTMIKKTKTETDEQKF